MNARQVLAKMEDLQNQGVPKVGVVLAAPGSSEIRFLDEYPGLELYVQAEMTKGVQALGILFYHQDPKPNVMIIRLGSYPAGSGEYNVLQSHGAVIGKPIFLPIS
jgi:hypothetical protein